VNAEFEEWFDEMVNQFELDEDEQYVVREAYKLGLNRGFNADSDNPDLLREVLSELEELNKEEE
jgi:hypothetical protein